MKYTVTKAVVSRFGEIYRKTPEEVFNTYDIKYAEKRGICGQYSLCGVILIKGHTEMLYSVLVHEEEDDPLHPHIEIVDISAGILYASDLLSTLRRSEPDHIANYS